MKYAHYFVCGSARFLQLSATPSLAGLRGAQIQVSGKRQARQLAAVLGATPYNF